MSGSPTKGTPPASAHAGRADSTGRPVPPVVLSTLRAPCLQDFITAQPDERLRDLLAFAMAVEAERPMDPEALRRKAEADLQAHAFRTMHNQVETIRLEAAKDQLARLRGGPGLFKLVLANLIAFGLLAGATYTLWLRPDLLPAGVF